MRPLLLVLLAGSALAADHDHDHTAGGAPVVPAAEHDTVAARATDGPTAHVGITVDAVGAIALAEVPELAGREVRARVITIAPGGQVAVHQHTDRPGFAYILEGVAHERRPEVADPIVHGPGSVAFERDGVTHWWLNPGTTPVRALVVDLVPTP